MSTLERKEKELEFIVGSKTRTNKIGNARKMFQSRAERKPSADFKKMKSIKGKTSNNRDCQLSVSKDKDVMLDD